MSEPVAVAVLAKAPLAGFAKTRLIPVLGAEGAARLQARLTERAVATLYRHLLGRQPDAGGPAWKAAPDFDGRCEHR